jgi:hypothetical protein
MPWSTRFALACTVVGVAAVAALHPVTVLELKNPARERAVQIPLHPGEIFSVISHHSMYERPVTEDFVVAPDRRIVLKAVSSPSDAVREYFGITAVGERHAVERVMREIVFRVAAGTPQRLRLGGDERSFLEFGGHGDRLEMRAVKRPALMHWLSHLTDPIP